MSVGNNIRVYYTPPVGAPPFAFITSSEQYVIMPPDQYWMQVQEKHKAPVMRSDNKGAARDDITQELLTYEAERTIWIPDAEKNERMKTGLEPPPINYMDVAHGTWLEMKRPDRTRKDAKHGDLHKFLKREDVVLGENRRRLDEIMQSHDAEIQKLLEEQQRMKSQLIKQNADMARALEDRGKQLSPEKPKDIGKR